MEKIIIKSAIKKDLTSGKTIVNIETEDGRCGSSYNIEFLDLIGKEVECDVKDSGKEYKNVKQYYFNLPKPEGKKQFPQRDWTFDKRKASLECAINAVMRIESKVTTINVLALAEIFYQYLIKK